MAWIYLVGSVESDKPWLLGSEPSPIVKQTDTPKPFCFHEWQEGRLTTPQSGTMCEPCGAICCRPLTSSLEASPVRTSAPQEQAPESGQEPEVASIPKSSVLLATFDLATSSWKMFPQLLFEGGSVSLETLPRQGMTRNGSLYQLQIAGLPTAGKGGGAWLTPKASETDETAEAFSKRMGDRSLDCFGSLTAQTKAWPTLAARDFRSAGTPEGYNRRRSAGHQQALNEEAVNNWQTPKAWDRNSEGLESAKRRHTPNLSSQTVLQGPTKLPDGKHISKNIPRLNPRFVEALLGYNPGVTELEPWAIAWIGKLRGKRSKS